VFTLFRPSYTGCCSLPSQVFHAQFQSPQQLASASLIPPSLLGDYKKLLATNPSSRLNARTMLEQCPFFQNDLVSSVEFLNNLALKSAQEKDAFFTRFASRVGEFPPQFCRGKILPLLTSSLEYGSGLTCFSAILQSVLQIGSGMNESEYALAVLPSVLKLFSSNERAIRVHLLQQLPTYATSLTPTLVNDSIFTHVQTGFHDANATLRELTVKSLLHLAPKLSQTNMDLALRHLARLQTDPEPAIRTNTGYCLAKIAPFMTPATQEKVLIPAFSKCLRDPFPPARVAGLSAFVATMELQRPADVARKVLPIATPALADDVREVREAALKLLEASVARMHAFHAQIKQQQEAALAANPNAIGSHQLAGGATATGAASGGGVATDLSGSALVGQAGAVLGSLGSWAASTVSRVAKTSSADAHPPPKHLQAASAQQQTPSAATGLQVGVARSSYGGSTNAAAAAPAATPGGSSNILAAVGGASPKTPGAAFAADDWDFDNGADDDEDDGAAPATLVTLSTSKKGPSAAKPTTAGAGRKDSTGHKKSILASSSGNNAFAIAPPPAAAASASAASNSLDSWDFSMEDSSSSTKASSATASNNASVVDDFDDWGASVAAPAPSSASHAKKPSTASSSGSGDLLSFSSSSTSTAHKKSPSAAASADPFAALSLTPKTSPPSSGGGAMGLRAKPAVAAAPMPLSNKSATAGAKKPAVDDWGDFLNS
jgi:SCY1-like protein 1